jgi:hypothetical protein
MLVRSECTTTHNITWDTIIIIVSESGTHVVRKVFHLFPCYIQLQVDILITRAGFLTLVGVVIVDLTHLDMVQWALSIITHAMTITV